MRFGWEQKKIFVKIILVLSDDNHFVTNNLHSFCLKLFFVGFNDLSLNLYYISYTQIKMYIILNIKSDKRLF